MKICVKCKIEKPVNIEFFHKNKATKDGWQTVCRECNRSSSRERQARRRADPEKKKILLREKRRYSKSEKGRESKRLASVIDNHIRRQREISVAWDWSLSDWEDCKDYWNHACAYCGDRNSKLTQDHFIPLASPECTGTIKTNMIPACARCNASKGQLDARQWLRNDQAIDKIINYFKGIKDE